MELKERLKHLVIMKLMVSKRRLGSGMSLEIAMGSLTMMEKAKGSHYYLRYSMDSGLGFGSNSDSATAIRLKMD